MRPFSPGLRAAFDPPEPRGQSVNRPFGANAPGDDRAWPSVETLFTTRASR